MTKAAGTLAALLWLVIGVTLSFAESITVSDGMFDGWTFTSLVADGAPSNNYAVAEQITTDGTPAPAVLLTTYSYTNGYVVFGVALCSDFSWNPHTQGDITTVRMNLDDKFVYWSQGWEGQQALKIVAYQSGQYFFADGPLTPAGIGWQAVGTAAVSEGNFYLMDPANWWNTALHPDFSVTAAPLQFGFAAGNHISSTVTHYYDNWSLTLEHGDPVSTPVPSTAILLGAGLWCLFGLRTKFHG